MPDPRWDVSEAQGLRVGMTDETVSLFSRTAVEDAFLANAAAMYRALAGQGVTPELLSHIEGLLVLERVSGVYWPHVGAAEMDFLWGCIDLLRALSLAGIKHGDLSTKNLVIRDNRPLAIDFQEAVWERDGIATKRPEPDAEILWRAAVEITGDRDRRFRRWQAMRGHVRGLVVDIGANLGHFCAMARLDSMADHVVWVDNDGDLKERAEARDAANSYWLGDAMRGNFRADTMILLSTWAHFIEWIGWPHAMDWLRRAIGTCGQVLFETQYAGDGPGPEQLRDDHDAEAMIRNLGGEPEHLVSVPVWGRECSRTVWRITAKDHVGPRRMVNRAAFMRP